MSDTLHERGTFPHANRVLRCRKTRRYYTGQGWSNDPEQAEKYGDEIQAAQACVSKNLRDIDLVVLAQFTGTELFSTPVR